MTRSRVFQSILISAGVILMAGCVTVYPGGNPVPEGSLDERYFQKEAKNYEKYQNEGQTVYCSTPNTSGEALIPYIGYVRCISEPELREAVRDWRKDRVTAKQ